nr:DUF6262 family protein [uncultured Clostridium sp.]
MKKNKNIDGLLEHSSTKNKETIDKVNQAIDKLKRSKTRKINFQTVAAAAGVSKATLYNNDELKERIMSLRSINKASPTAARALMKDGLEAERERVRKLNDEVQRLREDKKKLIIQLVELETLKDENQKLRESLKKLQAKDAIL